MSRERDRRLFQCLDADKISDALRRTIRQITDVMLASAMPTAENMLAVG
jgi:hypothetical protein